MGAIMCIGLGALAIGLIMALVSLVLLLSSPGKPRAWGRSLMAIGLGAGGLIVGTWLGIQYFCSSNDAGNLCGFGGVFGIGPLFAGLGPIAGGGLMLKARGNAP